jgi:cell division protein ZapA (FtsZ GTPase activity inhibitor)
MRAPIRPAINVPALFRLERRRSWPACCSAASNSRPDQADPKALGELQKLLRLPGRMNLAISVYYESHGRQPIVESVCRLHVKKTASDPVTSAASYRIIVTAVANRSTWWQEAASEAATLRPGSSDRKLVAVTIYQQPYTLHSSGTPGDAEALARAVDSLMKQIATRLSNVDPERVAVLACLHFAGRVLHLERDAAMVCERLRQLLDTMPPAEE